jgi:hypothetical protein
MHPKRRADLIKKKDFLVFLIQNEGKIDSKSSIL